MKEIFLTTKTKEKHLIYQEIKHLLDEYDHVRISNVGLRMTWNFYKSQKPIEPVITDPKIEQIEEVIVNKPIEPKIEQIEEVIVKQEKQTIVDQKKNNEKKKPSQKVTKNK